MVAWEWPGEQQTAATTREQIAIGGQAKVQTTTTATAGPSTVQLAKCASCFAQDGDRSFGLCCALAQDDTFGGEERKKNEQLRWRR
jgi:hypothetical protein